MLQRCNAALESLRRVRAGMITGKAVDTKKAIAKGFNQAFLRKRSALRLHKPAKIPRPTSWTHRFVCLSRCNQETIPTTDREKDALLDAGLGEKKIVVLDVECAADEFRELLLQVFPKLQDAGGYLFAKCRSNSRCLERLSPRCLTSPSVLRDRVGTARTYILPIQRDLDLSCEDELVAGVRAAPQLLPRYYYVCVCLYQYSLLRSALHVYVRFPLLICANMLRNVKNPGEVDCDFQIQ